MADHGIPFVTTRAGEIRVPVADVEDLIGRLRDAPGGVEGSRRQRSAQPSYSSVLSSATAARCATGRFQGRRRRSF